MIRAFFKNTLIISSLGHLLVFGLFSFSFEQNKFQKQEPPLVFWGQILPKAALSFQDVVLSVKPISPKLDAILPKKNSAELFTPLEKAVRGRSALTGFTCVSYSLKPQVELAFNVAKISFIPERTAAAVQPYKKDAPIMFHPLLPYQLQLYFKDRQAAHIELIFSIISLRGKNTILIKRKISSGNLEADLLSARYINHYLFIQQLRFPANVWQTVKIDFSTKND